MKHGQAQPSTEKQSNPTPASNWTFPPSPPYMPGALPYLYLFFSQQRELNKAQKAADQAPRSCVLF